VLVLTARVNEAIYCDWAGLPANFRTGCTLRLR
jgi:hypothetical protein